MAEINIKAVIRSPCIRAEVYRATLQGAPNEAYNGAYEVVPKVTAQELETQDKILKSNITVKEIPYYETSNNYGTTVTIGG